MDRFPQPNNDLNLIGYNPDSEEEEKTGIWDVAVHLENEMFDSVRVFLRDIEFDLIKIINRYKDGAIFGCVAWLTSVPILEALSKCRYVQIIVQKEDFLRPDYGSKSGWELKLNHLYSQVKCHAARWELDKPISELSFLSNPTVDGIRCVGNYNHEKKPAFPRSHHKFLVFCEVEHGATEKRSFKYTPTALWTGSYNMTANAKKSLENVLFLEKKSGSELFNSYLKEHHNIFCMSEPLDWTTIWVSPEYRIGS